MLGLLFTHTPLTFFGDYLWRDEAFSVILAGHPMYEILKLTARDFNPPLYYLILNVWMKLFGSSEIAVRTLSLLAFWGTVYMLFDTLLHVFKFSIRRALPYLLIFLLSPILWYFAFEARMYTLLAFFAAASYYALFTGRRRVYITVILLGLLTHYFMGFVIATQLHIILKHHRKSADKTIGIADLKIAAGLYAPWMLWVLAHKSFGSGDFWISPVRMKDLPVLPAMLYTGVEPYLPYFQDIEPYFANANLLISVIIVGVIALGFIRRPHRLYPHLVLWGFGAATALFAVSFFKPIFLPRYLLFAAPGILLACATALDSMKPHAKYLMYALLVFASVWQLRLQAKYRTHGTQQTSRALAELATILKEGDVVYLDTELDYFTAAYYVGAERVFIYNKRYEEIPDYVGKVLIPEEKIMTTPKDFPHKTYILQENGTYALMATK